MVLPNNPVDAGADVYINAGETTVLNATGGNGNYTWSPSQTLSCDLCQSPTAGPDSTTTYYVTSTSNEGCVSGDSVKINITEQVSLYVPNSFTPNNDNNNDVFNVSALALISFKINIYDRWGQLVFTSTDVNEGWNGYIGNALAQQDVYTYVIEARPETAETTNSITGKINLIR